MNYYKNDIRHIKGDTYTFPFYVEGLNQDLDSVYFTCRDGKNDNSEILFEKCLNDGITFINYDEETDTETTIAAIQLCGADNRPFKYIFGLGSGTFLMPAGCSVVVYGTGTMFQHILKNYDLIYK